MENPFSLKAPSMQSDEFVEIPRNQWSFVQPGTYIKYRNIQGIDKIGGLVVSVKPNAFELSRKTYATGQDFKWIQYFEQLQKVWKKNVVVQHTIEPQYFPIQHQQPQPHFNDEKLQNDITTLKNDLASLAVKFAWLYGELVKKGVISK